MSGLGLSAVVLCGGRSRRFGTDKGRALFRGEPLLERVAARLDLISDDVAVSVAGEKRYEGIGRRMVTDLFPGCGPLGGLHAALQAAHHDRLAIATCDMPFVSPGILRRLAELLDAYDAVVPGTAADRLEPLHAVYGRSCLGAIERALRAGERRVVSFYPDVRVRIALPDDWLAASESGLEAFANVNTPEDLATLEHLPWL